MKKILLIPLAFLLTFLNTQAQGIKFFDGTLDQAKVEAKKQSKYIFVDCTELGCLPCRKMAKDVLPRQDVGDFYNAHFICLEKDMFKGDGQIITEKYEIIGYPTYLYLDEEGELAHQTLGSRDAVEFINDAKIALNDTNNVKALTRRFERGEQDTGFLKRFIQITNQGDHKICEKAMAIYWDKIPIEDLWKYKNFWIFCSYEKDINSKPFNYVYTHYDAFLEKFITHRDYSQDGQMAQVGRENDSDFIYIKAAEAIKIAAETHDSNLFNQAKRIAFLSKYEEAKYIACVLEIRYYKISGQWEQFYLDADKYLAENAVKSRHFLYNNFAWEIVKNNIEDKQMLEKAAFYVEKCISYGKNYDNLDTYANVLYRLKRNGEAVVAAKEAIEYAKKEGRTFDETSDLLNEITSRN